MSTPQSIAQRLAALKQRIHRATSLCGRQSDSVLLLAVSKQQPVDALLTAFQEGIRHFGENYVQEALPKIQALGDRPICWHFIGHIQRNKTSAIATHFDWVHSVSSPIIAKRLNEARPGDRPALNVCIQLNIDNEASKSGVEPEEAAELAAYIQTQPHLRLRGLMIIPKQYATTEAQFACFSKAKGYFDAINHGLSSHPMDTLSMGMSHDFEAAIRAGSSLVRIGTALFGERIK